MGHFVGKRSIARYAGAIVAVIASLAAMFVMTTGSVAGLPSSARTLTYHLTDCSGAAGTPSSFDAVKQPGGAAALHVVGGGIFVVMKVVDVGTGATVLSVPGFDHNNVPTVTCLGVHPVTQASQWVTGILTSQK